MPNSADQFQAMITGLERVGLTRTEIARRSGVSRMTVWRGAIGECREPKHDTYVKLDTLCAKLNVVTVKDRP